MGMPALSERRWTRAEVLALPDDGKHYELVDGELLVTTTPQIQHQRVRQKFFLLVDDYVEYYQLGMVFAQPGDLSLDAGQVVHPDLFVIHRPPNVLTAEWEDVGIPLLVVEVLSPATARADKIVKRRAYQRAGVATYWIVDVDSGLVEVWIPEA